MKKIKLTESDLYRIVRRVLLEQEEEKKSITFSPGTFKNFITSSSGEGFVRTLNNNFDEIIINWDLDLRGTPIQSLPDNLYVGGSLTLYGTEIQSLPNNLHVGGSLFLHGTQIQSLPDNLRVKGSLYLIECKNLKSLPDNLRVGGDLSLEGTQIQSLPDNLDVKGIIYIYRTPLNYNDELVKKYKEKYRINRNL